MAKFFILHTTKGESNTAVFYVSNIGLKIQTGDEFIVFETQYPQQWKVVNLKDIEDITILECVSNSSFGLGYEDQFAGGLVDTDGNSRIEKFRYGDLREKDLYDENSELYIKIRRVKDKHQEIS